MWRRSNTITKPISKLKSYFRYYLNKGRRSHWFTSAHFDVLSSVLLSFRSYFLLWNDSVIYLSHVDYVLVFVSSRLLGLKYHHLVRSYERRKKITFAKSKNSDCPPKLFQQTILFAKFQFLPFHDISVCLSFSLSIPLSFLFFISLSVMPSLFFYSFRSSAMFMHMNLISGQTRVGKLQV